jgi:hypothetical protein
MIWWRQPPRLVTHQSSSTFEALLFSTKRIRNIQPEHGRVVGKRNRTALGTSAHSPPQPGIGIAISQLSPMRNNASQVRKTCVSSGMSRGRSATRSM